MPTATEACAPRAGAQQQEGQALQLEGSPCSPPVEKSLHGHGDPVQPKTKLTKYINKNKNKKELVY